MVYTIPGPRIGSAVVDVLTQVGIAAGALSAIIIFVGMMWRMIKLLSRIVEEVVGAPDAPSLSERIIALDRKLDEHQNTWHGGRARDRANGGRQ